MVEDAERFADELDRASSIEHSIKEEAIKKALIKEKVPEHFDGTNCADCDNEIPEARIKTGAFRCMYCQTALELYKKTHRRV